jgi:hypothetical protein
VTLKQTARGQQQPHHAWRDYQGREVVRQSGLPTAEGALIYLLIAALPARELGSLGVAQGRPQRLDDGAWRFSQFPQVDLTLNFTFEIPELYFLDNQTLGI